MTARTALLILFVAAAAAANSGCSSKDAPQPAPDPKPATPPAAAAPVKKDTRPAIVILGDSLSAGFGLETGQSYPDHLQKMLDEKGYAYRVVNQGVSGDTTSGGLARIDGCIAEHPYLVLLELGGNDGLRGIPTAETKANLEQMIEKIQATGAKLVLAGITLPRNYGPDYIRDFDRIYPDLARKYRVPLIPFLLVGLASPQGIVPGMIQQDGIHPTAKGTPIVAQTVFRAIEPLLKTK